MSINEITDMLINCCPDLRTGELNRLTHDIAELDEGEGEWCIVEKHVNEFIARGHVTPSEKERLFDALEDALIIPGF